MAAVWGGADRGVSDHLDPEATDWLVLWQVLLLAFFCLFTSALLVAAI
jgi:hypothetical protein